MLQALCLRDAKDNANRPPKLLDCVDGALSGLQSLDVVTSFLLTLLYEHLRLLKRRWMPAGLAVAPICYVDPSPSFPSFFFAVCSTLKTFPVSRAGNYVSHLPAPSQALFKSHPHDPPLTSARDRGG